MAEFKAGDRVVKMSGAAAGKYGTVNSVRDDGTLNVTFDGERLPRFCDPERCGQVGVNAKFKVGDRVRSAKYPELGEMKIVRVFQDIHGTAYRTSRDGFLTDDVHYDRTLIPANSRALNWNYRNSYQFFCVDPSMKAPCIYSGWDYREDAKDDAAELKEFGIPHKIVSRRFLEQNGIDPNDGASWKKNR